MGGIVLEYETKIHRPTGGYLEFEVHLFKNNNFVSIYKDGKWKKAKKVPEDFFSNDASLPRFANGYPFITTDISFILSRCPFFKGLDPEYMTKGINLFERLKYHHGGNTFESKWSLPYPRRFSEDEEYPPRMKEAIEISKRLYYYWDAIKR
jgi:hypothetical protein